MTRKADTLRPFLRCAAVVLCSLALPLAVFALWDRALLAAPHIRTDGERFSAAGRANATACTLYAAEHVTKVPLGSNSVWDGGWTAGTMDGSALARARRTLRALHEAGLLCNDSYAAALSVCRLDYGSWELYTAPCGLTQLVRRPEEIYTGTDTEHVYIQLEFFPVTMHRCILTTRMIWGMGRYAGRGRCGAVLRPAGAGRVCRLAVPGLGHSRAGFRRSRLQ